MNDEPMAQSAAQHILRDDLRSSIHDLLDDRSDHATICPSEAARAVAAARGWGGERWRDLMDMARDVAREMVDAGDVEITQSGAVVDPSTARGPIRIRRAR